MKEKTANSGESPNNGDTLTSERTTGSVVTPESKESICKKLADDITKEEAHLQRLKIETDNIFSSKDAIDYNKLNIINETIERKNKLINDLKFRQRNNGCSDDIKPLVAFDNQSILSTSMVRRKTATEIFRTQEFNDSAKKTLDQK